jgi:cytochrome P450
VLPCFRSPLLRHGWPWLTEPYGFLRREAQREGRYTFLRELPVLGPALLTGEPEVISEIVHHPQLDAGRGIVGLRSILGDDSLIMLDGAEHVARRALVSPALRGAALDRYSTMMLEVTREHVRRLPGVFSGHALLHDVSLHAIARVMFGSDPEIVALAVLRIERFLRSLQSPLMLFLRPLQLDLGWASPWGRALRHREALRALCRERMGGGEGLVSELAEQAPQLDREVLITEVLALLLFGHDTGAAQMAWALAHLLQHGQAERASQEPAWLEACLRESMRLCPVVVHLTRVARAPVSLAGHDLPADSRICPSAWLAQHNPALWPDPEHFDPTRFVGKPVSPHAWFPFGLGRRVCVGMPFVMRQMQLVLGTLLQEARLSLAPGYRPEPVRQMVLVVPSRGCPLVRAS